MNVIELCSLIEDGHCGYCQKRGKTSLGEEEDEETGKSVSLGIWAHYLTTSAYQELLDCGMRRSGLYVYKPIMERTCCPQYTIRLDTSKFFLSRNQKRCLRLMLDYLKNGVKPKCGPVQEMDIDQPTKITEKTEERNSTRTEAPSTKDSAERLSTKKKEKRRERCYEKWRSKGFNVQEMRDERERKEKARRRTTESYLEPHNNSWKHNLKVKLVKTDSVEFEERREESFLLFKKYQITIHQDKDVSEAGYKRFLVSDPFEKNRSRDSVPQFGAYHQWYILDEKLIAVGVIDILPHCLSSKYMYYDPDFNFLSLGTYTALREIEFTKKLSAIRPALKYYYMGYYIQSCPKMRYKGKFQPSELLCDKSFEWVPLSECQKMFAVVDSPYVTFRPNNLAPRKAIQDLTLLVKQRPIKYSDLPSIIPGFKSKESQKVHSNLTLLASLLPALPLRQNFLIFVGEIQRLASEEEEDDSSDSNDE